MEEIAKSVFGYRGKETMVRAYSKELQGVLCYIVIMAKKSHDLAIRVSITPTPMQILEHSDASQHAINHDQCLGTYAIKDVVMNADFLQFDFDGVSVEFLNPIDFNSWREHIEWLLHPINVAVDPAQTFKLVSKEQHSYSNLFVFRKYFTINDWKKTVQINNRLPYKAMMGHYTLGKVRIPQRNFQTHCFGREEINKQYYLQNNWQSANIHQYVAEIDPINANSSFHVYHFGKYYNLAVKNLESSQTVCADWDTNTYCCCEYLYYSGGMFVTHVPFSHSIESFERDRQYMLASIYPSNCSILNKYCQGYLQSFSSTLERMNNYLNFVARASEILNKALPNKHERKQLNDKCSFEEVLKYSMSMFEVSIKKSVQSMYRLKKQPSDEDVLCDSNQLRELGILNKDFHKLSVNEMDTESRWYSTENIHTYILVTDDLYEVQFLPQTAVNLPMLTYLSVSSVLKNADHHSFEPVNSCLDYINISSIAREACKDIKLDVPLVNNHVDMNLRSYISPILDELNNMVFKSRINYTLSGTDVYLYTISLITVKGYSIDYVMSTIMQRFHRHNFTLLPTKIAIDTVLDLHPYMKYIFGRYPGYLLTGLRLYPTYSIQQLESIVADFTSESEEYNQTLISSFSELCSMRISPRYNLKKFEKIIKYQKVFYYYRAWFLLAYVFMFEIKTRRKNFSCLHITTYLFVMNLLIKYHENPRVTDAVYVFISGFNSTLASDVYKYLDSPENNSALNESIRDAIDETLSLHKAFAEKWGSDEPHIERISYTVYSAIALAVFVTKAKDSACIHRAIKVYGRALRNILNFYMLFYIKKSELFVEYAQILQPLMLHLQVINRQTAIRLLSVLSKYSTDEIIWAFYKLPLFSNTIFNVFITDVVINTGDQDSAIDHHGSPECNKKDSTDLTEILNAWFESGGDDLPSIKKDPQLLHSILSFYYPKKFKTSQDNV
ncbi:hypothetical protein NEMIN01_2294 [Nematocida minor]|uniref:uncharacterized protein n=1 Tax=Nematocida minor TaxID=1912983 RepID=UPI00221EF8A5|nr:uncharacterized protein NEMIN01_2294 [Nematocida minor]KAI5192930.1 hypothetical protein NEMIN01_2294 [Nematocida minor]